MNKCIPLWFFLIVLLLGALFVMVFGWAVKSAVSGGQVSGIFGKAAVAISSFPTLTKTVFSDMKVDLLDKESMNRVPRTDADLSNFSAIRSIPNIDIKGLVVDVDKVALAQAAGWRILTGAFFLNDKVQNAAIVLSPELEVVKVWLFKEEGTESNKVREPHRKFIHGFDFLDDGSVIFSFDGGRTLQRLDKCGNQVWSVDGPFHHSVTLDDNQEFVWVLHSQEVMKVATETGEIARYFKWGDIIAANPTIDILEIRRHVEDDKGDNSRKTSEKFLADPFHLNDIEPLSAALSDRYKDFDAGDIMLSARNLNLIFVLDPATLKIKWWRSGATKKQHDPDWSVTGEITVYDNRMGRDYSRIVSINPESYVTKVLFDGHKNDFYSRVRGKHQITKAGNILITSPQQGRFFEIDADGNKVLEIVNTKPNDNNYNFVISQAMWVSSQAMNFKEDLLCTN